MTLLFCDVRGFTTISEQYKSNPQGLTVLINRLLTPLTGEILEREGTIDKYMGDCAMIVFGVPEKDDEHLFHGLCCAVMIQRLVERLNEHRHAHGQTTVKFRIGINSGDMLAGNLGSRDRMQYTVVGDAVNLASRLSNLSLIHI